MITDYREFEKYLVDYDTYFSHSTRNYKNLKSIRGKLLFTTFITYNPVTNKISSNKVSRIIATDLHSSTKNIAFCAPCDDCNEKLPTTHGIWYESSSEDMIKWELPIFTTHEEANEYCKKMYKVFSFKRKATKENLQKSTVTLEEIADKFNKKRKRI